MNELLENLEGVADGVYSVTTAAGTGLLVDLDRNMLLRIPGIANGGAEPGFASNQFSNDGEWMTNVSYDSPIRLGETVRMRCDPPMNWYISTPVRTIERVHDLLED